MLDIDPKSRSCVVLHICTMLAFVLSVQFFITESAAMPNSSEEV